VQNYIIFHFHTILKNEYFYSQNKFNGLANMYISVIQAIDKITEGTIPNGLSSILLSRQPQQGPALSKK